MTKARMKETGQDGKYFYIYNTVTNTDLITKNLKCTKFNDFSATLKSSASIKIRLKMQTVLRGFTCIILLLGRSRSFYHRHLNSLLLYFITNVVGNTCTYLSLHVYDKISPRALFIISQNVTSLLLSL